MRLFGWLVDGVSLLLYCMYSNENGNGGLLRFLTQVLTSPTICTTMSFHCVLVNARQLPNLPCQCTRLDGVTVSPQTWRRAETD
jgi:hypothetical protein